MQIIYYNFKHWIKTNIMEIKERKFGEYKFEQDDNFRKYIESIEPPPPLNKISYYKRKYYKLKIDPDFVINYGSEFTEYVGFLPKAEVKQKQEAEIKSTITLTSFFQMILFSVFLVSFPIGFYLNSNYYGMPLAFSFFIGIFKKNGFPKFQYHYWQIIFSDDHFHNFINTIVCILSNNSTVVIWFPLIIRAISFISECLSRIFNENSKIYFIIKKFPEKSHLFALKGELEIYLGFYLTAILFLGWVSFLLPLFYWQIIQFRYLINDNTKVSIDKFASELDSIIIHPSCPFLIRWLLTGLRKIGTFMVSLIKPYTKT